MHFGLIVAGLPLSYLALLPSVAAQAYGVVCNPGDGSTRWGLSGWLEPDADANSYPDVQNAGAGALGFCVDDFGTVETMAFQGCGQYYLQIYQSDDCSSSPSTAFANYGPAFVPSRIAIPAFQSYSVFDGLPPGDSCC